MTPHDEPLVCTHHGEHRRFCSECGARLQWRCACETRVIGYGGWYPMEWNYCPGCGQLNAYKAP